MILPERSLKVPALSSKVSSVYGFGGVVCLVNGLISKTSTISLMSTFGSKSSFSSLLYTSKYPLLFTQKGVKIYHVDARIGEFKRIKGRFQIEKKKVV